MKEQFDPSKYRHLYEIPKEHRAAYKKAIGGGFIERTAEESQLLYEAHEINRIFDLIDELWQQESYEGIVAQLERIKLKHYIPGVIERLGLIKEAWPKRRRIIEEADRLIEKLNKLHDEQERVKDELKESAKERRPERPYVEPVIKPVEIHEGMTEGEKWLANVSAELRAEAVAGLKSIGVNKEVLDSADLSSSELLSFLDNYNWLDAVSLHDLGEVLGILRGLAIRLIEAEKSILPGADPDGDFHSAVTKGR